MQKQHILRIFIFLFNNITKLFGIENIDYRVSLYHEETWSNKLVNPACYPRDTTFLLLTSRFCTTFFNTRISLAVFALEVCFNSR